MKYGDLLRMKDSGDLRSMLDALAVYWYAIPKVERSPYGKLKSMVDDVLSYRRKTESMSPEYVTALWRSTKFLLKELGDIEPSDIIEENHVISNPMALDNGYHWIFPDLEFVPCENPEQFILDNQGMFVDRLGIDGFKMMHARHSEGSEVMRIVIGSGAVLGYVFDRGGVKKVKYQCCQKSLPWLKSKIRKMAILRSIIRVYDPAKPYGGFNSGIMFIITK